MLNKSINSTTRNYVPGDLIKLSGLENLLVICTNGEMVDCHMCDGYESVALILTVKSHEDYGGEAEMFCDGEFMILPWRPGQKPELQIVEV